MIGLGLSLTGQRTSASLASLLFGMNEPGFTFEPWDITTLYQDRAGATPVTAAGQSVGLRLDKSQGLRIGPELVTNGDVSVATTGWTAGNSAGLSVDTQRLKLTNSGATFGYAYQSFATVVGKSYLLSADVAIGSATTAYVRAATTAGLHDLLNLSSTTSKRLSGIFTATSTTTFINLLNSNQAGAFSFYDNISVRELAGNHEVAVSDAKRGTYGWMPKTGRRNLLNATDALSTQSATVTAVAHTLAFTGTGTVTLSGTSTAGPLVGTGAGNRVSLTFTPTAGSLTLTVSGSVTLAQLELGSTATAYQRVVSQYDITEAGVPTCYYVQADGVDDAYLTPTITPNTDKAQVFAGVRKLSDATVGMFIEYSATATSNSGTMYITAPELTGATGDFRFKSRGSINTTPVASGTLLAPTTKIITGLGDISGDTMTLRIDGVQVAQSTADQGTGNYLAYSACIYARGGTLLPFNGLDFGHAVRFGPNLDAATIAWVESLIARNTPEVTL